jgi:uncharacterized RDD family membrane protein YckC
MTSGYEATLRASFSRMSTEELVEREQGGVLTPEGFALIREELERRGVSKQAAAEILREARISDNLLHELPAGLQDVTLVNPWVRFFAHVIDQSIAWGVLFFAIDFEKQHPGSSYGLWGVLTYFGYLLLNDALPGGMSIGKRLLKIQVVSLKDGLPCSVLQALKRNITTFIPVLGFFDVYSIFGPRYQRIGDRWARTIVISERRG